MDTVGILFFTLLFVLTSGHSWVERIDGLTLNGLPNTTYNGTVKGPSGYGRGFVDDNEKDVVMTHLLPPNDRQFSNGTHINEIIASDLICSTTQDTYNQTMGFPSYIASPGSKIVLRHQENGHVTLLNPPVGKESPGLVYVYGTSFPRSNDTILSIHKVWSESGLDGDRRGKLLSVQGFDDGRCYQINDTPISQERQKLFPRLVSDPVEGADIWCRVWVTLPLDLESGMTYTLYWVWDWPTSPVDGQAGKTEIYTSCIDIVIA